MSNKELNILILTASYGNGHKTVANTIRDEFMHYGYSNITICDLYQESHPIVNIVTKQAYIKSYDYSALYSLYYNGIEKLAHSSFGFWYRQLGKEYLKDLIFNLKPDIIINTFPVMVSSELKQKYSLSLPIYSIVTDFCVHKIWLNESINRYYIAHSDLTESLINWGISHEQIYVSGIPIKRTFENPKIIDGTLDRLKKKYKYNNKKIILINAGAFGVMKDVTSICDSLEDLPNIQTIVICGKNAKLKDDILERNYYNIVPLGFINNIHHYFNLAHCIITKPGGITLSEATSCGLPLILYNPVPGQEMHNAKFFEGKNAATIAITNDDVLNEVMCLINDPQKVQLMKNALNDIHQKNSAKNIVEDILSQLDIKEEVNCKII